MRRLTTLATAGLLASAGFVALTITSRAAPELKRVRGSVESASETSVTVKTANGRTETVTFLPDTGFVSVIKASLDDVKDGKFIGTATKGEHPPTALEVVIFPESMKGTGEGHYAWDPIADTTGTGAVKSSMTNGTVKKKMIKSAMTNGTIKSGMSSGGSKMIDVTYDNGQSLKISVPPSAPIVAFEPADKSILKPGAILFSVAVVDGDKLNGKLVAVGKDGVTPPM